MNTQIINAELQQALRKCLPFVRRHAIISGGDGSLTYAFAVRALADADARHQEEAAVKNIVTAEQQHERWLQDAISATLVCSRAYGYSYARKILNRFGVKNVRAATTEQLPLIERLMKMSPSDLSFYDYTVKYSKLADGLRKSSPSLAFEAGRRLGKTLINGQEAKQQAAAAVRPSYTPAAPPAKGCDCEVCTQYSLNLTNLTNFYKD